MAVEVPLVLEIEKHEVLYNYNLPEYNRKDTLDQAWAKVAASVDLTVTECKDKWKNIRSSYLRSLKVYGGKLKKPYYLSNYLQFVLPYLKPTGTSLEMSCDSIRSGEETNETIIIEDPVKIKVEPTEYARDPISVETQSDEDKPERDKFTVRKRRRQMVSKKTLLSNVRNRRQTALSSPRTENFSALRYFLLSLLPEFETMTEEQIRQFKIKVMMLIDDLKSDGPNIKRDLPSLRENERLQKRLINLLLRNIGK